MIISFDQIRQQAHHVCELAQHVTLHPERFAAFVPQLRHVSAEPWFHSLPVKINQTDFESALRFSLMFNATSFCYWQKPKWRLVYEGVELGGAFSLATCYALAINGDRGLLEPERWANLSLDQYSSITAVSSGISLPLSAERLQALQMIGSYLCDHHHGSVQNFITAHDHDAERILQTLATAFYGFDDVHDYHGQTVPFLKRAQLTLADLSSLYQHHTGNGLRQAEHITACADYKLPQIMRHYGLLSYSDELAQHIDTEQQLPSGSTMEIEIRAGTIEIVELLRQVFRDVYQQNLTANQISDQIWLLSQNDITGLQPHHRTVTMYY